MNIQIVPVGALETNCYVLSLEGRNDAVIIDPGDDADKIKAALGDKQVAAILLTHGHYDHTGALYAFPDVPIYLHPNDHEMLTNPLLSVAKWAGDSKPRRKATHTVVEGQVLKLAGLVIQVLHTPGHTQGCVCYAVGNDIFTGDTLFDGDYGRTDLPGGDAGQMRKSIRRLLQFAGRHAYPGHGTNMIIQ
ncbi:MAG: MBL fold metallo-hydrolase [Christensenellales bacterium]|jgi:hydroxyacylglutathione hydrolase